MKIVISGGAASGKSYLARKLVAALPNVVNLVVVQEFWKPSQLECLTGVDNWIIVSATPDVEKIPFKADFYIVANGGSGYTYSIQGDCEKIISLIKNV